jgi:hypothetical protein
VRDHNGTGPRAAAAIDEISIYSIEIRVIAVDGSSGCSCEWGKSDADRREMAVRPSEVQFWKTDSVTRKLCDPVDSDDTYIAPPE